MKKRVYVIILAIVLTALPMTSALAAETVEGPGAGTFGRPTSVDQEITVGGNPTESDNINRSANAAVTPPAFGSPSSSQPVTGAPLIPGKSGAAAGQGGITLPGADAGSDGIVLPPPVSEPLSSGGGYSNKFTLPDGLHYSDKSIGTLSIPKLKMTAKVYEEESLENLAKGIGHFKFTSCWEGNVGFAAHNRGIAAYFGQIHMLKNGDKIVYTTKLGTRTYSVYFVGQINETDLSRLGRTEDNIVTLVTCVRDVPAMRVCVQARLVS